MSTKHFRLLLVKASASFFADSVTRLLSAGPVFRTISIVNVFIEKRKYSQLPLLRTPSGLRVSVPNSESPYCWNLFQSNVCNLFFAGDLAARRGLTVFKSDRSDIKTESVLYV